MKCRGLAVALILSAATLGSVAAYAQEEAKKALFANPTFNLNPPGARSLGMGAAFIGLSDDATASESNPAGLAVLTEPEFSINLRASSIETNVVNPFSDFFRDVASFGSSTSGPSFVSYAHPQKRSGATFSVYYQQAMDFRGHQEFVSNQGDKVQSALSLQLEHAGLSGAFRVGRYVYVGASARYSRADFDLINQIFIPIGDIDLGLRERVDDSGEEFTFNVGLLVNSGGKISLGAVYKQGADFEVQSMTEFNIATLDRQITLLTDEPVAFTVPDSYGIGIALRPSAQWTIGLDLIRVLYSDSRVRFAQSDTSPEPLEGDDGTVSTLPDGTEIHFGMEYGFTLGTKNTPVFVRVGYYTNPDHDGEPLIDSDQNFITAGAGVFLKNKLQLDAAIAISEDVTETLISMVWRL